MTKNNKTKICFIVSEDWYFYSHRFEIAKKLLKQNYEIHLICKFSNHRKIIENAGIKVFSIDFNRSKISFLKDIFFIFKLSKIISKYKFNIIHSVGIKIILITSIANLFNFDNKMINAFAGMGHLFTSISFKNLIYKKIFVFLIKLFSLKSNNYFLVQNTEDKRVLQEYFNINIKKIFLIPGSGINTQKYTFIPKDNPTNKNIRIIMHSRILIEKGVIEFYQASQLVFKQNRECKFILIGKIDKMNPTAINKKDLLDWSKNYNFEWIDYKENIKEYIYQADISCLPSYREGFPKSILEDCACGTPVICTDIAGCNFLIKNDFNGLLVEKKSKHSLNKALIELINNNDKRMLFANRSRKIIEDHFSIEPIYFLFKKMYDKIL